MTSLSEQLRRLALPGASVGEELTKRASLLFEPKKAATLDRDTFYALGVNGFEELCAIDNSLHNEFHSNFFSETAKNTERSVLSQEDNLKLNNDIQTFLLRISPFFLMRPAQKCLEWLIYRFRIHCFNVDDILRSLLPFHDTKLFVKFVQLMDIAHPTNKWCWIAPIQKPGVTLAKATISMHCVKDSAFFYFICDAVIKMIMANSGLSDASGCLRSMINFYASVTLGMIHIMDKISDQFLTQIVPFLVKGLKSKEADYQAATYIIISQISIKATLTEQVVMSLLKSICKNCTGKLHRERLTTIIIICQTQENLKNLPKICLQKLCSSLNFMKYLDEYNKENDIERFLKLFLSQLVSAIFSQSAVESSMEDADLDDTSRNFRKIFLTIIQTFQTTRQLQQFSIKILLEEFVKHGAESATNCNQLIQQVQRKFPESFDNVIANLSKKASGDGSFQKSLNKFMSISMDVAKHQSIDGSTSLVLSLCHPESSVRLSAINTLQDMFLTQPEILNSEFVKDSIKQRLLYDDDPNVVFGVLKLIQSYPAILNIDLKSFCDIFIKLVFKCRKNADWDEVYLASVTFLSGEYFATCSDVRNIIAAVLYDVMLQEVCVNKQNSVYSICVRSSIFQKHSNMLVLHKTDANLKSFVVDLIKLLRKNTTLVCDLWQGLLHLSSLVNTKDHSIEFRPAFYYLISHAIFEVFHPADTSSLTSEMAEIYKNVLFNILDDLEQLVCQQQSSQCEEPQNKKAKLYFLQLESIDESLTKFVNALTNVKNDSNFALMKVDLLCSILMDCFKLLKKSESNKIPTLYQNYSIIHGDCFRSSTWSSSTMHLHIRNAVFSHLLRCLSFDGDEKLKKILRSSVQNFFDAFPGIEMLINFLASYWNLRDDNSEAILSSVQSLYLGQAVLLGNNDKKLALDAVIPTLLTALSSKSPALRKATLAMLDACLKYNLGPFGETIDYLVRHRDELESDPLSIIELIDVFFSPSLKKNSKQKLEHKNQKVLNVLLREHICSEDVPTLFRVDLLKILHKVNSEHFCSMILPTVEKLMNVCEKILNSENDVTMSEVSLEQISIPESMFLRESILKFDAVFFVNDKIKSLFKRALSCNLKLPSKTPVKNSPQSVSLGMVNKNFFSMLDRELKQELLSHILDVGTKLQNPSTTSLVAKFFKAVSMDAGLIAEELTKVLQLKKILPVPTPVKSNKMQKGKQILSLNVNEMSPSSETWRRTTLLLELIQHKKKIFNLKLLFPALFEVLEFLLDVANSQSEDSEFEGFEYTKQLLLTTMLNHFQKLKTNLKTDDKSKLLSSNHCKIELLVQCVRTSENAQTQQHALLLLSEVATMFPDEVLHNVMSIFTFMGSHMLRQDDAYTFQVITTTIRSILPTLIKSDNEKNNNKLSNEETVITVLRVFIDSLPHIPSHRRTTVFQEVLSTVGDAKYLWMILVLLVDQYSCKPTTDESSDQSLDITASDSEISDAVSPLMLAMEIWTSISRLSSTVTQVKSLISCLEYMITIPNQSSTMKTARSKKLGPAVLDIRLHSTNQLRKFKLSMLTFFSHLLQQNHSHFVNCLLVDEQGDKESNSDEQIEEARAIRFSFQRLFEILLDIIHQTELSNKESADPKTVKYYKVLIHKSYNVMHQINFLLPLNTFLLIIDGLLRSKLVSTQRKALELLAERIPSTAGNLEPNEAAIILKITKELMRLSTSSVKDASEKHSHSLLRYSSLITMKLIIRSCAKSNSHYFVDIIPMLADIISNNVNEDNQIISATLLCLAELCSTLKAYCISHLNSFVPALLQLMCTSRSLQNEMILFSCITALHRLLEHLPNFISPFLDTILTKITSLLLLKKYALGEDGQTGSSTNMSTQISMRLKVVTNILATKVPSRVLIPAFNKCREKIEVKRPLSLKSLADIVHKHVAAMDNDSVGQSNVNLSSLFLEILDVRTKNFKELSYDEVDEIEGNACEALVTMMLKLSENVFRPLFFQLYDWACLSEESPERLITYYKLMYKLSSRMKGLFSMFAGHLINHIVKLLKGALKSDTTDTFPLDGAKTMTLLKLVCDTLYNTLLYDSSGFLTRERFELLMQPVVGQLEYVADESDEHDALVGEHVIPCLGQMAASVSDDVCWKPFNYQILIKSRHSSPKVRFMSLHAIQIVAEKLGEDYTILLPESVPFFAELMEDEEETVEKKCHEVVRKLEKILGEPLQKYF